MLWSAHPLELEPGSSKLANRVPRTVHFLQVLFDTVRWCLGVFGSGS
jgi:hypothetical protein